MRIILSIIFLFSNYAIALDQCLFEMLLHDESRRLQVRSANEMVSLKVIESAGVLPFISIKSYSNKMTIEQLAIVDEVIGYNYFGNEDMLICIDSCRFYEINGTKFIEGSSFDDVSLNFVVEALDGIHVFNLIYDNKGVSFYDYYVNFDCGSNPDNALFEEVKDILER